MIVIMIIKEGVSASCTDVFLLYIFFVASRRSATLLVFYSYIYQPLVCAEFPHEGGSPREI